MNQASGSKELRTEGVQCAMPQCGNCLVDGFGAESKARSLNWKEGDVMVELPCRDNDKEKRYSLFVNDHVNPSKRIKVGGCSELGERWAAPAGRNLAEALC